MSDDSFKNFNINPPSLDFLEDIYKSQLIAMNRVRPTIKVISNMNALALDYSHLFRFAAPRFTVPTVNLGIDLEKLYEAISRINEPLIKARETVNSITAKQYRATLFSEEIFNDVYNLSGISPEIIENAVTTLRFNAKISINSMKTEDITNTIKNKERNKIIEESQNTSAPLSESEGLKYLLAPLSLKPIGGEVDNLLLSLNPFGDVLNNLSFDDLFVSNQLAFGLVCIYIYACAFIRPYK